MKVSYLHQTTQREMHVSKRTRQESVSLDPDDLMFVVDLAAEMILPRSAVIRMLVHEAVKARLEAEQREQALRDQQAQFLPDLRM